MSDESRPIDGVTLRKEALERLPKLKEQISELVAQTDPIELLSQLTLLYQSHPVDELRRRDESGRWQTWIEWLAWLVFSRGLVAPDRPEIIDSRILTSLGGLLEEYFRGVAVTLLSPTPGVPDEREELFGALRIEALFVRGEGFQHQFERTGVELYSPHEAWCRANLGLTIQEAFAVAREVGRRFTDKLQATRKEEGDVKRLIRENPRASLDLDLPPQLRALLPAAPCDRRTTPLEAERDNLRLRVPGPGGDS